MLDAILAELDDVFDGMYATGGRASVPPETLLKAAVLMAMYSIRSERVLCERLTSTCCSSRSWTCASTSRGRPDHVHHEP